MNLALLGDPVAHSRSPAMHNAALAACGISGRYVARRVDERGMAAAAEEVRSGALDGANITMPHKGAAFRLADSVHPEARRAGSVNTWVREAGLIHGHSTDIEGIRRVWEERSLPTGGRVVVLGSGGAAAAALVALDGADLRVVARRREAAAEVVERTGVAASVGRWEDAAGETVVVNCTPLGMGGEELPDRFLHRATGLLDMAYGSGETPAVAIARSGGLPVADGLDLLVTQAEASFRLWTGRAPPPGVMAAAAKTLKADKTRPNHERE